MPRLRNKATGVVVNVADGKTLNGYEPVTDTATTADSGAKPTKSASTTSKTK